MACGSCGGGRSSSAGHVRSGVAESWRLTDSKGGEVYYTDGERAKNDRDALNSNPRTAGARLEKVNPVTGAVLSS